MSEEKPKATVASIVGIVGGIALSRYCGSAIWIPGAAMIALLLLFTKSRLRPPHFVAAVAITAAHVVWFVIGAVVGHQWAAVLLDVIALSAGVVWLWLRPGLGPVIYLGVIEVLSLAVNVNSLLQVEIESVPHRTLTAHIVIRIATLACLVEGYLKLRKGATSATEQAS